MSWDLRTLIMGSLQVMGLNFCVLTRKRVRGAAGPNRRLDLRGRAVGQLACHRCPGLDKAVAAGAWSVRACSWATGLDTPASTSRNMPPAAGDVHNAVLDVRATLRDSSPHGGSMH